MSASSGKVYYGWITTWNTAAGTGTDPQVYISHEIIESITDPDANISASGWTSTTFCPGGAGACELADQCELTTGVGNYTSLVNGVNCWSSSYYSNKGGGCQIPAIVSATSSGNQNFTWGGGRLLQNATICLIFSGGTWSFTNSSTPTLGSADDIKRGVQALITQTAFYNGLAEYSVTKPTFQFAAINSTTVVPNPFLDVHIQQVVKDAITAGLVPNQASSPDPIIYFVVLNSTPHYTVGTQIGGHGQFSFTPPPPTSTPTSNPPGSGQTGVPPANPTYQGDQWGITMIYPTRASGGSTAWFLPANPNVDTRHVVDSTTFTAQADGSYRNTQTNVTYNIAQSNGFTEASLALNQATLTVQRFMQDNKDWTNIEMTFFARVNSVTTTTHAGPPVIIMAMDGAKETNDATLLGATGFPKSCEAADYRIWIEPVSGYVEFMKDLQYTAGLTASAVNPHATLPATATGLAAWQADFTGIKAVCYTMADGVSVAIELWVDPAGASTWTQVLRYIDTAANWNATVNLCGGSAGQTINWGGPLSKFIWQNISSIDIKWASIREIDVYAYNPQLLVPPAVTPPAPPPNNLPANPPPPNQPPPVLPGTGTLDKFGVKMMYPTLSGGQTWYLSSRGLKGDSRVLGIPRSIREYVNGDGSFRLSANGNVLFYVSTLAGYNISQTGNTALDHALCRVRQYMFTAIDWKNVEVTVFHNVDMVLKSGKTFDFGIKCRTGSHSRSRDCQGSCYEIQSILFPGLEKFFHRKEQWHDCHTSDDRPGISFPFSNVMRRWVGEKFITFNIRNAATGKVTGVRLEHWWNDTGDGITWTKVNNTTDIGGWGILDRTCNGNADEVIIWGGPLIGFFWNDFTNFSYKWMSIREIDTTPTGGTGTTGGGGGTTGGGTGSTGGGTGGTGGTSPPGGPPSTSPPTGPPPLPPKTAPLIGADVYNIFRFPYNVILDDTGGCGVGVDPNSHLGETPLSFPIPGTGSSINLANTAGAAYVAGQHILNTSSVLYNQVIAEFQVSMRLVGLPADSATVPIVGMIYRGLDGAVVNTFGQVSPSQLTSQFRTVTFKSPAVSNYTLGNGDLVGIKYTGGDASNYVQLQTDNTSGYDGTNGTAADIVVGSTTFNNVTGFDVAGGFWSTGQTGVQASRFYFVDGSNPGGPNNQDVIFTGPPYTAYSGGITRVAEAPVNGSSTLIGKVIYEIDIWLLRPGGAAWSGPVPSGTVSVYLLDVSTQTKTLFGSISGTDIMALPNQSSGFSKMFAFLNYSNTVVNSVNTYIVIENNSSATVLIVQDFETGGVAYDGNNTNAFTSGDGITWTQETNVAGGTSEDVALQLWTSATPPPGTLPPGTGLGNPAISVPVPSVPAFLFLGGLQNYFYSMVAMIANDSQSKLIGLVVREVDVSLKALLSNDGQTKPSGSVAVLVFNSSGGLVGSSNYLDVGQLSTSGFLNTKFLITLYSAGYALQTGDRIALYFQGRQVQNMDFSQNIGIGCAVNTDDPFDGNHTVVTSFTLDGSAGVTNQWLGIGGKWTVNTSWDLGITIYT